MRLLSEQERGELLPAELSAFDSPIPTQIVSSDEFVPTPQTPQQREVEARLKLLADELAHRQGMTRRRFLRTAAGMAAAFVAMNDVYGPLFGVSRAEAATPEMADERAKALAGQFIFDGHTHFLREDTQLQGFVRMREAVGKAGWNPELAGQAPNASRTSSSTTTSKKSSSTATPRSPSSAARPPISRPTGSSPIR